MDVVRERSTKQQAENHGHEESQGNGPVRVLLHFSSLHKGKPLCTERLTRMR